MYIFFCKVSTFQNSSKKWTKTFYLRLSCGKQKIAINLDAQLCSFCEIVGSSRTSYYGCNHSSSVMELPSLTSTDTRKIVFKFEKIENLVCSEQIVSEIQIEMALFLDSYFGKQIRVFIYQQQYFAHNIFPSCNILVFYLYLSTAPELQCKGFIYSVLFSKIYNHQIQMHKFNSVLSVKCFQRSYFFVSFLISIVRVY